MHMPPRDNTSFDDFFKKPSQGPPRTNSQKSSLKDDSQYSNIISDYLHCSQVKILLKMLQKLLSLHPNSISLTMTLSWWPNEWQILVWLLKLKQFKMPCITNIIFQPNFGDSQRWFPQDGFQLLKRLGQVQSGRSKETKWVGPQIRVEVVSLETNQDVMDDPDPLNVQFDSIGPFNLFLLGCPLWPKVTWLNLWYTGGWLFYPSLPVYQVVRIRDER